MNPRAYQIRALDNIGEQPRKRCSKCKLHKPLSAFGACAAASTGLQSQCKECQALAAQARRDDDPERSNRYSREWHRANPEKAKQKQERWKAKNRTRYLAMKRGYRLKHAFGLTPEQFAAMFEAQGGVCAICGVPPNPTREKSRHLHVDHCHATNRIRGLLCNRCNRAIGLFGDDPKVLASAIRYLNKGATL